MPPLIPTFVLLSWRCPCCFPVLCPVNSRHGPHTILSPKWIQWRTDLQDLPVPEGHETNAGAQTKGPHQPLLGRTERAHGDRTAERRWKCFQIGEGGYPRADSTPPSQPEETAPAGYWPGAELPGSVPGGFYPVRAGGVAVFICAYGEREPGGGAEVASAPGGLYQAIGYCGSKGGRAEELYAACIACHGGGPTGADVEALVMVFVRLRI